MKPARGLQHCSFLLDWLTIRLFCSVSQSEHLHWVFTEVRKRFTHSNKVIQVPKYMSLSQQHCSHSAYLEFTFSCVKTLFILPKRILPIFLQLHGKYERCYISFIYMIFKKSYFFFLLGSCLFSTSVWYLHSSTTLLATTVSSTQQLGPKFDWKCFHFLLSKTN